MTENISLSEEERLKYKNLCRVFHPDKVDKENTQVAKEIFDEIINENKINSDPALKYAMNEYGKHGVEIVEKHEMIFKEIKNEFKSNNYEFKQKLDSEIQEILISEISEGRKKINVDFFQKTSLHKQNFLRTGSLTLSNTINIFNLFMIPNISFQWDKNGIVYQHQNLTVGFINNFYKRILRTGINIDSAALQNIKFFLSLSNEKIDYLLDFAPLSSNPLTFKVQNRISPNSDIALIATLANNKLNGSIQQGNRVKLNEKTLLKINFKILMNSIMNEYALNYNLNESTKLFAKTTLIFSYFHKLNEYHKIESIVFGIRKSFFNFKVSFSAVFKYYNFKHLFFGFSYHRFNFKMPIALDKNENVANLIIAIGWSIIGLLISRIGSNKHIENENK